MIRKLTLREWFLVYQLDYIERNHAHLSAFIEVDITKLLDHFGEKIPFTRVLIKACGILQAHYPPINKQIFKTFFGMRFYSCEELSVNVPIVLESKEGPYVSVVIIENPDKKSLSEIQLEIKNHSRKTPESLPVGKILLGRKNHFLNRMRLKILHFFVNNFPGFQRYFKVGTVCVSSLLNLRGEDTDATFMARGHGAMSLCVTNIDIKNKKVKIGISWDHFTGNGFEGVEASHELSRILQGRDLKVFKELIS